MPYTQPVRLPLTLPPETQPFDVVAVGESSVDLLGVGPRPDSGSSKTALTSFQTLPGGQAATVAVGCARLGLRACYVGATGDDAWGALIRQGLEREGVAIAADVVPGVPSRTAIILVNDASGERQVFEHRHPRLRLAGGAGLVDRVRRARVLMVDATDPTAGVAAAEAGRAAGIPTVVDVDRQAPGVEALLRHIDLLVMSESFAAHAGDGDIGRGLQALAAAYRPALAVATVGAGGSVALCHGREVRTPALPTTAMDTTGAGDAFRVGLIAGLLWLGPNPDVDTLMQYANAAGSLNCRAVGAQGGLPSRGELEAHVTRFGSGQSNETR